MCQVFPFCVVSEIYLRVCAVSRIELYILVLVKVCEKEKKQNNMDSLENK